MVFSVELALSNHTSKQKTRKTHAIAGYTHREKKQKHIAIIHCYHPLLSTNFLLLTSINYYTPFLTMISHDSPQINNINR